MKVLLVNQAFYPDVVATAQLLSDFALKLVERGHQVTVVASSRGYDDTTIAYPTLETWRGVRILRIWNPGLGKKAKWRRWVNFGVFWLNATRILLFLPKHEVTVCLTSPPLISTLGTLMVKLKGGAVVPWIMDLNPDEAVAAGWLKKGGLTERILTLIQNWSFQQASRIIALDRFMADRLRAKGVHPQVIHTDAPWSHDQAVKYDPAARDAFRSEHGLHGKFVVMYSGNHSPCHPLDTILAVALELRAESGVHFFFVGGGSEFKKVHDFQSEHGLNNVTTLPYQPMEKLSGSLSSADLHLVVMGEPYVGMVHPCKIYNILNLGLPFLFIGPEESHGGDLSRRLADPSYASLKQHGDTRGIIALIREAAARGPLPPNPASQKLGAEFSHSVLCPRLVRVIEDAAT